jgi:vanillate O-demethylase ferredoxin subunit
MGLHEGATLQVSAPRNNFALDESSDKTILIAGGIGITPILSMALRLESLGKPYELQYFSRSIAHTAFHEHLSQKKYADHVGFHYALEPEAVRGYLRKYLWHRQAGAQLYLCGPRPFMDLVEQTAAITWPPESVHLEYFTADPASLSGPRDSFVVRLARSGGELSDRRRPDDHRGAGRTGITVRDIVRAGCLRHLPDRRPRRGARPSRRLPHRRGREANDRMTPCVSRSCSPVLVLDL